MFKVMAILIMITPVPGKDGLYDGRLPTTILDVGEGPAAWDECTGLKAVVDNFHQSEGRIPGTDFLFICEPVALQGDPA